MRCVEFAQRWNEALDLRGSPEDDVDLVAHLESCHACRASHVGFELVCDVLRSQPLPELSANLSVSDFSLVGERGDLAERVLADLAAVRRPAVRRLSAPRFRGWAVRAGAAGVAAATLLALYLAGSRQAVIPQPAVVAIHSTSPRQVEPAASYAPNPTVPAQTTADIQSANVPKQYVAIGSLGAAALASVSPSDLDKLPDLSAQPDFGAHALVHGIDAVAYGFDAVGTVARDTSQELATAVRRIPDVAIELAGDGRTDLQVASETLFNVSHSLRPVAASMTETWHIFKRALPAGEPRRG
jgi:hypothetical protein